MRSVAGLGWRGVVSRALGCWGVGPGLADVMGTRSSWELGVGRTQFPAAEATLAGPGQRPLLFLDREVQGNDLHVLGTVPSTRWWGGTRSLHPHNRCRCCCCPHLPEGRGHPAGMPATEGGRGSPPSCPATSPTTFLVGREETKARGVICFCLSVLAFLSSQHIFVQHRFLYGAGAGGGARDE